MDFGWIFGYQDVRVEDKEDWAQLDGEYFIDAGVMSSLQFGVRHAEHSRESNTATAQGPGCRNPDGSWSPFAWAFWPPCATPGATSPYDLTTLPTSFQHYPGDFGGGLGGNFPRDIVTVTDAVEAGVRPKGCATGLAMWTRAARTFGVLVMVRASSPSFARQ